MSEPRVKGRQLTDRRFEMMWRVLGHLWSARPSDLPVTVEGISPFELMEAQYVVADAIYQALEALPD